MANLIAGGVYETFARLKDGQIHSFLADGNNNTIRLLGAAQEKIVDYSYEPYGKTQNDRPTASNSQQYTGRENDNPGNDNGLYYYRNRYYMPGCARFISEDPIGWASGQTNNYSYVRGNPVSFSDPYGLAPGDCYRSPDDAAKAAGIEGLGRSPSIVEHGGWIYPRGNGYTYNVTAGTPGGMPAGKMEKIMPTNPVSAWHTHPPEFSDQKGINEFSEGDLGWSARNKMDLYLTSPNKMTKIAKEWLVERLKCVEDNMKNFIFSLLFLVLTGGQAFASHRLSETQRFSLESYLVSGYGKRYNGEAYFMACSPEGREYPVYVYDYIGKKHGKVLHINKTGFIVEETVEVSEGEWKLRKQWVNFVPYESYLKSCPGLSSDE